MNSIAEIFINSNRLLKGIENFVDKYIGSELLRKCGIRNISDAFSENRAYEYCDNPILRLLGNTGTSNAFKRIVSAKSILADKILAGFHNVSPYLMFKTDTFFRPYKKDTFYRFDLNKKANWERLQIETARNVILDIESRTNKNHTNVLIFDDSLYQRTGGKGTDLCSKVFDHNDHKMRLGFRMMTGGWSNGETYVPFSQCLLTTRNPKLMVGKDEQLDQRTIRGRRRHKAKEKGTAVVQSMVKDAQKARIPFEYVIFDTWFSSPTQLVSLKGLGTDVIAMVKKNSTKYEFLDPSDNEIKKQNTRQIFKKFRKRPGRSKYLLSVDVKVTDGDGNSIPARLVYARNYNNKKDWVCFISTDMGISEENILRIYTMRWACEVYFRVSKSYLKLRTECHSTSYDAITAHMVVVAIRYMILALFRFENTDNRGIKEIMYGIQREIVNEMMDCAITLIIDTLLESIRTYYGATESQINDLIVVFINKLPEEWRCRFSLQQTA